ncbi:MAG: hypothetical protein ACP5SH_24620 [Syntrophobacteraceae bacterium]
MNKTISAITVCLAAALVILSIAFVNGSKAADKPPVFDTTYQAVLLDSGQVYYGKISRLGGRFAEMTDVYYIINQQDPKTKAVKHVLVKRGMELHQPTETFLNVRHIIMIEPVGANSEVAKLIAESEKRAPAKKK